MLELFIAVVLLPIGLVTSYVALAVILGSGRMD
jgi:alkylated DNA nucleotide flippase Atl1